MKKAILLALFLVGCVFATDLSNVNPATIILGTDSPTIIDDKIRYLAEAVNTSYDVEHHLTGEHQIPYGLQADRPASPKDGQLFFNLSSGQLEMYMSQTKSYTGTADVNDGKSSTSQLVVVAAGAKFLSSVHTGASVDFYLTDNGSGGAVQIDSVDSDTQLTLKSAYGTGGAKWDCSVSGTCDDKDFTVRLNSVAQWVAVDKLIQEAFEVEHHIRVDGSTAQTGAGEHKIQIRTDGTDPTNVKNNQWWFDTTGGTNSVKFRDSGTTKTVTTVTPDSAGYARGSAGFNFTPEIAVYPGSSTAWLSTGQTSIRTASRYLSLGQVLPALIDNLSVTPRTPGDATYAGHAFTDLTDLITCTTYTGAGTKTKVSLTDALFTPSAAIIFSDNTGNGGAGAVNLAQSGILISGASQWRSFDGYDIGAGSLDAKGVSFTKSGSYNAYIGGSAGMVNGVIYFKSGSAGTDYVAVGSGNGATVVPLSFTPQLLIICAKTGEGPGVASYFADSSTPPGYAFPMSGGDRVAVSNVGIVNNGILAPSTYYYLAIRGGNVLAR